MSLKMVPFDRLCMMSYEFTTVTLSLRHTIFEIFDFKNAVTLKTGLGARQCHWKCHHSIERIRIPIDVLYTMAVSRVVYVIFNVEKCHVLEILVRGHSRSLKMEPFERLGMVFY